MTWDQWNEKEPANAEDIGEWPPLEKGNTKKAAIRVASKLSVLAIGRIMMFL